MPDSDPNEQEKQDPDPDPNQVGLDPRHWGESGHTWIFWTAAGALLLEKIEKTAGLSLGEGGHLFQHSRQHVQAAGISLRIVLKSIY